MSGTYTWWVQNDGPDTGSQTLALINMPSSSGTISAGGSAVTMTTTRAGQDELITFSGTAGQQLFLTVTNVSTQDAFLYMIHENNVDPTQNNVLGWVELSPISGPGYWYYIKTDPLPTTDTYVILLQHVGSYTGSQTLQLYDVTNNVTGTITAGGSPITVSTTVPGQDAAITFTGSVGENVYLLVSGVSLEDAYVDLYAPDGTLVGWFWTDYYNSTNYQFNSTRLTENGTYTWFISNFSPATGSETLQLYAPPNDVTGAITVGGSPITVNTTAVGQGAEITFSGTASQSVTLNVTRVANSGSWIKLIDPNGNYVDWIGVWGSGTSSFTMGPDTLPSTGTYTLWVQPAGTAYGSETLQLH
jgi:hypothetical protein